MRKKLMSLMTASMVAIGSWAQAPTADLLDIVFKSDGTAEDVSAMKNEVKTIGLPQVVESPKYGMNVACLSANYWGFNPQSYYRVDFEDNQELRDAMNDGFTYEVLVRPVSNVIEGGGLAGVLSAYQGGGASLLFGDSGINFQTIIEGETISPTSTTIPTSGQYYHAVAVVDPANSNVSLYVDGQLAAKSEAVGSYVEASEGNRWFAIGGDTGSENLCSNAFAGDIALARVYSAPLTAEQVAALYQEVTAKDTGAEEHEATPAKNGYFTFNPASSNHLIVTQEDMYQYHFEVTGGDPFILMSPLQADLADDEYKVVLEYKSNQDINNAEFFYSPIAGGREAAFNLLGSEDWTTAYIDIQAQRQAFDWGKAGDFLRIDLGTVAGTQITLRNVRIISFAEYKELIAGEVVELALQQDAEGWYLVNNEDDLLNLAQAYNTGLYDGINVRMTDDIDMSSIGEFPPIGWTTVNYGSGQAITEKGFSGIFDGQGHTISGLTAMHNTTYLTSGVFGTVTGTIKNLGIDGYTWTGGYSGRHAALAGVLLEGRIENCFVVNSRLENGNEIVSAMVAGNYGGTIENSFEIFNTVVNYQRAGYMVGDNIDDNKVRQGKLINCYSGNFMTGEGRPGGYTGGMTDCQTHVSAERFASGEIAYLLNKGNFGPDVAWHQNLEDDLYPVLDKTHDIVAITLRGTTLSLSADNGLSEFTAEVAAEEIEFIENTICLAELTEKYTDLIAQLEEVADMETFTPLYEELKSVRSQILSSEGAYKAYDAKVAEIKQYLEENTQIEGSNLEKLQTYLGESVEPDSALFPNGSYVYIMKHLLLDNESLDNEVEFVQHLLDRAIATGYQPGADVTNLIVNADFASGTEGWTSNVAPGVTTVDGAGVTHVAESGAKLELNQTLSELRPGLYELTVYAAYNADNNNNSYSQHSYIYAGDSKVYTSILLEGQQPADPAPANADKYTQLTDIDGNIIGYLPTNANGLAYAFGEGLYKHTIVAEVGEEGTLTIGVSTPGCNSSNTTWVGPFSMKYLGAVDSEYATEALDAALACQTARFTTLSEMYPAFVEENNNANVAPNYSNDLKTAVAQAIESAAGASTNEEKLAKIAEMSTLAQEVLDCKAAYTSLMTKSEIILIISSEMHFAGMVDEAEANALQEMYINITSGCVDGTLTKEQAESMNPFENCTVMPKIENNVIQLTTPAELVMLSYMVSAGMAGEMEVVMLNDIDMAGINFYAPIGHCTEDLANKGGGAIVFPGFQGVFDGKGHSIKNLTAVYNPDYGTSGVFGKNSGIIRNLIVDGYTFAFGDKTPYGGRHGALCGVNLGTIENCAVVNSTVDHNGEIVSGIAAGNYGGLVFACFEADNNINPYPRAGHLVGDNVDDASQRKGKVDNCYSAGYVTGEGRSGGYTGGVSNSRNNAGFSTGEIAYLLNKAIEGRPELVTWKQNIYEDPYPVLDQTHMDVLFTELGYSNYIGIAQELLLASQKGKSMVATLKFVGTSGEALITSAGQITDNCVWSATHAPSTLLDNNPSTHFHSDPNATTAFSAGEQYLQVDLGMEVMGILMEFRGRGDGEATGAAWHDTPNKFRIMVSNNPDDAGSWVEVTTLSCDIPNGHNTYYMTDANDPILFGGAYRHVRFYVLGTTSGNAYWNLNEFMLYSAASSSESYYAEHPEIQENCDKVEALCNAVPEKLAAGNVTEQDVAELKDAISALRAMIPGSVIPFGGTEDDPIIVGTAADMAALHNILKAGKMNYVILTADIDMAEITEWTPLNTVEDVDDGKVYQNWIDFDGYGHVIRNFTCTTSGTIYNSFFGVLAGNVKNVGFENATVVSDAAGAGILAAYMGHDQYMDADAVKNTSSIYNVWVTGKLTVSGGYYAGGLVGNIAGPSYIKNCYTNVEIVGDGEYVGGLVGRVRDKLDITQAYAAGTVSNGGGIIGGGQQEATPGSTYNNIVVWNNTDQNFGPTAVASQTTLPVADLLDVVFNEDGSATDVSANQMEITTMGAPTVAYSEEYGRNIASFHNNTIGGSSADHWRVSYQDNDAFKAALTDGFTMETTFAIQHDNVNALVKPFSSMESGGFGFETDGSDISFLSNDGSYRYANSFFKPQGKTFYHCVGVYDAEGKAVRLYVNGTLVGEGAMDGNQRFPNLGAHWIGIGGDASTNATETTNAANFDIVTARMYNDVLTAGQIAAMWNAQAGITTGDKMEHISYYDGTNFAALQQTVVGWGNPWQCSMAEDEYPTFDLATAIDKITNDPALKGDVVSVYNTSGQIVYAGKAGQMNVKPGIYVIKAGGRTFKMAIK